MCNSCLVQAFSSHARRRRGAVVVLVAAVMLVVFALVAFAVDIGTVLKIKTDMQRTADAAALAAAQNLAPAPDGSQNEQAAREAAVQYVQQNMMRVGVNDFQVADEDIVIGRYDPSTIYSGSVQINPSTEPNVVRVTLRRDGQLNPRSPLFFGQVLGFQDAALEVTATAVLPQPDRVQPGVSVLPFAFNINEFGELGLGDSFVIYGDGKMTDGSGNEIPGNWGTLDIGDSNNSTSELADQITNGLRPSDLVALQNEGRISESSHIDGKQSVTLQGDPGLSSGMKSAVQAGEGQEYLIPLFDQVSGGGGNNNSYRVVGWAAVTLVDSKWQGAKNTWVQVSKAEMYSGNLTASNGSLSNTSPMEGVYGAPLLVR